MAAGILLLVVPLSFQLGALTSKPGIPGDISAEGTHNSRNNAKTPIISLNACTSPPGLPSTGLRVIFGYRCRRLQAPVQLRKRARSRSRIDNVLPRSGHHRPHLAILLKLWRRDVPFPHELASPALHHSLVHHETPVPSKKSPRRHSTLLLLATPSQFR